MSRGGHRLADDAGRGAPALKEGAERATEDLRLARPPPAETRVLVTSALLLPRAVAAFEAAGWAVLQGPVDY